MQFHQLNSAKPLAWWNSDTLEKASIPVSLLIHSRLTPVLRRPKEHLPFNFYGDMYTAQRPWLQKQYHERLVLVL